MCYSPLFIIKRNTSIFDREQGIKLAINVLQLLSVEKNSKLELNLRMMLYYFNIQMTMLKM